MGPIWNTVPLLEPLATLFPPFGLGTAPSVKSLATIIPPRLLKTQNTLLFFPYNMFHMYISIDNIVYFSTWYVFPVSPVHGGHYYS